MRNLIFLIYFFILPYAKSYGENSKIDICSLGFPTFANTVDSLLPTVVNISTSKKITKKGVNITDLLPELPKNSPFEYFFKDFFW